MSLGKKHEVSVELENYLHLIIGDKKIGKSTLVADIAEELYGSIDKVLMLSIKNEKAFEAINGAVYEEPQTWLELMENVKEFVAGGHKFRMLSFDTIDELMDLAMAEVIRLHTIEHKEVPKGFNACFGGYAAPRRKVQELINSLLDTLKDTGYGYYFIGHNKIKSMKNKVDDSEYTVITSNLANDYFNTIAYKCPIICNIVSEVELDGKALNSKTRFMHFRDDAFIEAGSRFSELPKKVAYGGTEYIKAVKDGIKASIEKRDSDFEPEEDVVAEIKEESKVETKETKKVKVEEPKEKAPTNKDIVDEITNEFLRVRKDGEFTQDEIVAKMKEFGTAKPTEKTKVEILNQTLEGLKLL